MILTANNDFQVGSPRRANTSLLAVFLKCLLAGAMLVWGSPGKSEQELTHLYAPRPPKGSAFVRIAIARADGDVSIDFASSSETLKGTVAATKYYAVPGNRSIEFSLGRQAIATSFAPREDEFATLVIGVSGSAAPIAIEESNSETNDLKARLRLFNLVPACTASLRVANGPTVFQSVAPTSVGARSINPVAATLEATCREGKALFSLPRLGAGDHYSLFLRERQDGSIEMSGQFDETAAVRAP
jgi:hypothetical protein